MITACHAANIFCAANGAFVIAVRHDTLIDADHATDIYVVGTADGAGVVTVCHGAVVIAYHAAYKPTVTGDSARVIAVRHGAVTAAMAYHAADVVIGTDVGIDNAHILHSTAIINITEQANISGIAVIEVQASDGIFATVKGTFVYMDALTYGGPYSEIRAIAVQLTVLGQYIFIDRDICGQFTVNRAITSVNRRRKGVQLVGCADIIVIVTICVPESYRCTCVNGYRNVCCSRTCGYTHHRHIAHYKSKTKCYTQYLS